MASIQSVLVLLACFIAIVACAPGGYGGHHEHVIIKVPHHVHTIHHHHTKTVKIPVVHKEYVHVHHHDHSAHSHGDFLGSFGGGIHGGGWW